MYKNAIKYNNGIHLNGMTPLDDRLFLDSRSDVFVDPANLKSAKLYNRAYNGMVVGVHEDDGTVTVMSLNNVAPYKPDNTPDNTNLTVDETNYKTYWTVVLGRILFEDAKPVKLSDTSAYIRFADTYSSTKYIEVGSNYPRPDGSDFVIDFIPEKWQCVKSDNSSYGDVQIATQKTTVRYFLYDMEHPWKPGHGTSDLSNIYELTSEGYHEHYEQNKVDDGDKSQYYAYVSYTGTENIKDSDGNDSYVDNNGNTVYYRNVSAIDTSTRTVNTLRYTGSDSTIDKDEYSASLTLIAGWKIYTNASDVSTNSIWNDRYIEPAVAFRGNNEMIDTTIFSGNNVKFYAKWPGETTEEHKFYVYVQNSYKIGNIGGAHDTIKDDWTAELGSNLVSSDITITNGNQVNGTYKKYEITKSAGITNAEITIIKENN